MTTIMAEDKKARILSICLWLLTWVGVTAGTNDRHVVVSSIDGLPGDLMRDPKFKMPVLRHLERDGASCRQLRVSLPTVTRANHVSMVTGVRPIRMACIPTNC